MYAGEYTYCTTGADWTTTISVVAGTLTVTGSSPTYAGLDVTAAAASVRGSIT